MQPDLPNIDPAALTEQLVYLADLDRRVIRKGPPPGAMPPMQGQPGSPGVPGLPASPVPGPVTGGALPPGLEQQHEATLPRVGGMASPPKIEV